MSKTLVLEISRYWFVTFAIVFLRLRNVIKFKYTTKSQAHSIILKEHFITFIYKTVLV